MKIRVLILVFALSFAFFAQAQVRSTDITLEISPQYPMPNQSVLATLGSYSTDLNKAQISWSKNGVLSSQAVGKKTFSFNMGPLGSSLAIEARIETPDGQSVVKTIVVSPAEVDMLYEAYDVYTPPFYRGRALVPTEGTFKVVAMPNLMTAFGKASAANLSYNWTMDNNPEPDSSGWGKNYLLVKNSYLDRSNDVEVTASDALGSTNATGSISLKTDNPKIIFYRYDPAFGVKYEQAIADGFVISQAGETLVAEPYFFSPKNINSPDLSINWSLNGENIETPSPKNILSIKPDAGQSGVAIIKVAVNNTKTLFQSLEKQINVAF